ncbi:MAG: PVC-type heme-binding CxxCH protein, partial [Limisphaerales bacterium]
MLGFALAFASFYAQAASPFEWRDGDRVAFVGGVFMEREQDDGYIETMLTLSAGEKSVVFRNFGWGGDTVESHLAPKVPARPKYVPNLFSYLEDYQPTVVLVSYGMMESFRGEEALPEFIENYRTLLDKLSSISNPRIILISPFRHEKLGGHFPDPIGHNRLLELYVRATEQLARERGLTFMNLFNSLRVAPAGKQQLTSNGVHLNSDGYREAAALLQKNLGLPQKKLSKADREELRRAIQRKNKQWWYHYRPMNSEYVYPGGTRYQNDLGGIRHPMFSEIEAFADLAKQGDKRIAALLKGDRTQVARSAGGDSRAAATAPDPELERATFQMAEGLDVNLFAADPNISKPVQMAFDNKGRLWVATTTLYPQIKPGEEPTDSIVILEDVDGDGRADKTVVFADGLVIPTGVLPYRDGAFVFDDTTLLFLRDTNGDGRAETREVVLSGFGTEDSHHKGHTLRWGPEGRVHFNVGVFLHNNIETAHGLVSLSGYWQPGIFAYDPATGKLDVHLANSVPPNPWGHYWNRWGFDFHIDSSGQQGSNLILPTSRRTSSAIPVPGGQGKLAGGELISGRHFPQEWHGNLVSAPFKENRLARWHFSDDGSGYAMTPMPPVIVSTDPAFRPVDHHMGPDGALYVSDWYNPLIGHMQHHFRDPGRDFTHGRIWRITAKGRPLLERPRIAGRPVTELLELLKVPEDFTRLQVRRELAERPAKEVVPALNRWVQRLNSPDHDFDHNRIEALWIYQCLKVVEPDLLRSLLTAKDPNARAAAAVVLRDWQSQIPDRNELLSNLVRDPHPRVRLQGV